MKYWEKVLDPDVILLVAVKNNKIIGTVQLHLCLKQNGQHRAEIAKLMTHPDYQRQGIARLLMRAAEERAQQEVDHYWFWILEKEILQTSSINH